MRYFDEINNLIINKKQQYYEFGRTIKQRIRCYF